MEGTEGPDETTGDETTDPGTGSSGDDDDDADSTGTTGDPNLPDPLPPLAAAPLTTEQTLVPLNQYPRDRILDPRIPDERIGGIEDGLGDFEIGPGEPILDVTYTGDDPTPAGPNATMLARFVHLADTQLADDESPTRVIDLDELADGAFRTDETHLCNVLDAAVRTINRVNEDLPLDFMILGGDNIDNAQSNELDWFLGILDGAPVVHCDSGEDDDPEPDAADPKDPFAPVGLDVPWYWVSGNHDTLVQGNFEVESRIESALGDTCPGGTRDWSQPGGPVVTGDVIADESRALLQDADLVTRVSQSGDGHGIDQAAIDRGEADYTFDVEGTDLRFIVIDTSASSDGGSEGILHEAEVDDFLRPALDAAEADGMRVIVVSHHRSTSLSIGGDALGGADFQALLGEYDNILMHLCGHSHLHAANLREPMGGNPYWEVVTSALADFPGQMRVIEIHDQDNGEYRIQMVSLDYATDDDPLGAAGRTHLILDMAAGWAAPAVGDPEDRNVSLTIPVP